MRVHVKGHVPEYRWNSASERAVGETASVPRSEVLVRARRCTVCYRPLQNYCCTVKLQVKGLCLVTDSHSEYKLWKPLRYFGITLFIMAHAGQKNIAKTFRQHSCSQTCTWRNCFIFTWRDPTQSSCQFDYVTALLSASSTIAFGTCRQPSAHQH